LKEDENAIRAEIFNIANNSMQFMHMQSQMSLAARICIISCYIVHLMPNLSYSCNILPMMGKSHLKVAK